MTTTFKMEGGDIVLDGVGHPTIISDGQKLNQDISEMLAIQTKIYGFGAGLESMVGHIGSTISHTMGISRLVRDGVSTMIALQKKFQYTERPDEERISLIRSLNVYPVSTGSAGISAKTAFAFRVDIQTTDNKTKSATGAIV
jgi:hypothetical protein